MMHLSRFTAIALLLFACGSALAGQAQLGDFSIRPISGNEFYSFVEVFAEMRGPLRSEILRDSKTDFEDADPLKYVARIKGEKDVKKMLKKHDLTWDKFADIMGNIVLAYLSTQPQKTKAALLRQLGGYGLDLAPEEIPDEYKGAVAEALKTEAGSSLAAMALDLIVDIPEQNLALVRDNKISLDKMFYTRFWRDRIVQ